MFVVISALLSYFFNLVVVLIECNKSLVSQGFPAVCFKWSISDTPVGTEELGHLEMVGTLVYQLTRNLSDKEIKESGFDTYFVDHTTGIYPVAASGTPWSAGGIASKGDVITDLTEDMAADAMTGNGLHLLLFFGKVEDMTRMLLFYKNSFSLSVRNTYTL